ncbi:MAG: HAD hydrolase-like protein [Acidobacteria bacterium]|nr:HAD hydrolase-like protein [Acidobacteriota bacterium]
MRFHKSKPGIQLLIFDLDGTLIDSKLDLALSVNATLDHLGRQPLDEKIISSYVGQGAPTLIRKVVGEDASPEEIDRGLEFFLAYYREHKLDHTDLYPGTRETLERLANGRNGSPRTLAVLTNKPERISRAILAGVGVGEMFRFIYGGNTFETKKPDPYGLRTILENTGADSRAAMIVGDSDVDIQTGINAGVWTCGVTYGFGNLQVELNPPDLVIHSLPELAAALDDAAQAVP